MQDRTTVVNNNMAETKGVTDPFSLDWCSLEWTSWLPFSTTSRTIDSIPDTSGLYRIRPTGQKVMMFIGCTGESLRQCFSGIRQNSTKAVMPWNDPWPVAPALWAWKDAKGYAYEFSSAIYGAAPVEQQAAKSYLTYRYRLEIHESPLCSFGRFHRKYSQPSDQKVGLAGGKIGPGEPLNPAGGPSASPLTVTGRPGESGWMGLSWSPKRSLKTHTTTVVPPNQGYYLIFDTAKGEVLAIGRSEDCAKALFEISKKPWDNREFAYSFVCEPKHLPIHNLMERENDLIGNYIEQFGNVPEYQFLDGL
jgi:hypothetical protein